MKATFFVTATALLQLASAVPLEHAHRLVHEKRDAAVATTYVQAASPDIVVVDQDGKVLSTSYANQPTATPTAQVSSIVATPSQVPAPVEQQAQAPKAVASAAQAAPAASTMPAPAAPTTANDNANSGATSDAASSGSALGVAYSPYNADHSCKSMDQVSKDFQGFNGFSAVRLYGTDCNQVSNVITAAKAKNMKVMLGVFDVDKVGQEMNTLIQGVGNNWDMVSTVSIGNELVNSKGASMVGPVVQALGTARSMLKNTAFKGSVVTVDTFNALKAHPQLCQASDFAAANAHAFFDATATAGNAGQWLKNTVQDVQSACGKKVVITESGWPSQGSCNGQACPSEANQKAAIGSIKANFKQNVFLYSAYNDLWKDDFAGSFGCEKFWGIMGTSHA